MIKYQMLHHVGVNVTDLARAKVFYTDVLCLSEIERPNFSFPGAWFAIGTDQQLHLIVHNGQTVRSGQLDSRDGHFALRVSSYEETVKWLSECGVPFDARPNSTAGFPQIYVLDPDRNIIELNADSL
jgi:glyoxylase I family protein